MLALAAFGWLSGLEWPMPRLGLPGVALACYGLSAVVVARGRSVGLRWIWLFAILMRASLIPLAPELSDDVYRYLWDGHVQLEGINPYRYAPAHEALEAIRTPWHALINNPDVPTIYPPLAQGAFLLVAMLGGTILSAKLLWTAFDLLTAVLLIEVARRRGLPVGLVGLLYLWSPLLIVETAWSAHFDAFGLFWLALLLLWSGPSSTTGGSRLGATLAAATMTKFAPLALLPSLVRQRGSRTALVCAGAIAAFYLPYVWVGLGPLTEGLRTYSEHWTANEGAFRLIRRVVDDPLQARAVAGVFVLGTIGLATWHDFSLDRAMLWILGAGLLFSPTIHPWYVLWILPAAALRSNIPLLSLSGLVFLGYWGLGDYLSSGSWPEPWWAPGVVWIPPWALLAWYALRLGGMGRQPQTGVAEAQEAEREQTDERGRRP